MSQPLSDQTIALVKATVPALEAHGLDIVREMYARMFQSPEIRELPSRSQTVIVQIERNSGHAPSALEVAGPRMRVVETTLSEPTGETHR